MDKVRIKDIAEIANVSIGTVDRVIHKRGEVSQATRECTICHSDNSRIYAGFPLARSGPGNILPVWKVGSQPVAPHGTFAMKGETAYEFRPAAPPEGFFILGHDRAEWAHWTGAGIFLLMVLGILLHGTFRFLTRSKRPSAEADQRWHRVFLYTAYQRFWHWLQASAITGLIITGLVIHAPDATTG